MNTFRNRKDIKNMWKDLWTGDFWFSDNKVYLAHRTIIKSNNGSNINNKNGNGHLSFQDFYNSKPSKITPSNNNIKDSDMGSGLGSQIQNIFTNDSYYNDIDILDIIPSGYIKLFLEYIDINQIFIKHNITLTYLDLGGQKYIKSFILGNEAKEVDCYSEGENESLTIKKDNNSIIKIILKEKNGNVSEFSVVNGIVIN